MQRLDQDKYAWKDVLLACMIFFIWTVLKQFYVFCIEKNIYKIMITDFRSIKTFQTSIVKSNVISFCVQELYGSVDIPNLILFIKSFPHFLHWFRTKSIFLPHKKSSIWQPCSKWRHISNVKDKHKISVYVRSYIFCGLLSVPT